MAEMVGSAVVQEVVSGAFSFMRNNHEEMASQSHLMERLKFAHLELKFALERTKRMPIIEVSLLQRRMMLKHVFEESRDLLYKLCTPRANLEDEGAEQGVTLSSSLPNRIMHAVKPFFGSETDSISGSCVRRFELFAEKTDKFVRDVESGFSLALYRFSCPIITQLLEGKYLNYKTVCGSQSRSLSIVPYCREDYGVLGNIIFRWEDLEIPMKCFCLHLMIRLSESTDIIGISTKCFRSLEPELKPVIDVASGELTQMSTQVSVFRPGPGLRELFFNFMNHTISFSHQEPLCCIGDGFQPSGKNIFSSILTEWFAEEVSFFGFECFISAAEYNLEFTTAERHHTVKDWPILQLKVIFAPHFLSSVPLDFPELSDMAKFVPMIAVNCFKLEPERTEYSIPWYSAHGHALFTVSKPTTEMGRAPKVGDGSKTRRASKRRR